jgi:hypothetical protein
MLALPPYGLTNRLIPYPSEKSLFKNLIWGQTPVAHTCNPSYSGGKDQEDRGSKPAWANGLRDPISKKRITKKGW